MKPGDRVRVIKYTGDKSLVGQVFEVESVWATPRLGRLGVTVWTSPAKTCLHALYLPEIEAV